jgi:hypothetical protein
MNAKDIHNLLFNPQWTSKLLHYFISGAANSKDSVKFELIYIVLPLIFDEVILEKLESSNKSSSFTTLFKTPELKNRTILLNQKVEAFRGITNQALIYLGNKVEVKIDKFIQIGQKIHYSQEQKPSSKFYAKSAYNLGLIMIKEDYKSIFVKFEIVNI